MLSIVDLSLQYGSIVALKNVAINIAQGEIISLIGANGAGKSSLIAAITGLAPISSGEIYLDGELILSAKKQLIVHQLPRYGIALVPEGRRVFADLTVRENLEIGGFSLQNRSLLHQQMKNMFAKFPLLDERQEQRAGLLSGGEQQMLAIARALMSIPRLLLLDEPSLGLAPLLVDEIMTIIKEINGERRVTILLVEQNARQALALSHRAYILENGAIQRSGLGKELLHDPEVRAAYLGG